MEINEIHKLNGMRRYIISIVKSARKRQGSILKRLRNKVEYRSGVLFTVRSGANPGGTSCGRPPLLLRSTADVAQQSTLLADGFRRRPHHGELQYRKRQSRSRKSRF
jgi:hypothetical protein